MTATVDTVIHLSIQQTKSAAQLCIPTSQRLPKRDTIHPEQRSLPLDCQKTNGTMPWATQSTHPALCPRVLNGPRAFALEVAQAKQ